MPRKAICQCMKISRMALWKIEQRWKKYGDYGLKDHKVGRLFQPLNAKFYNLILEEWRKHRCGARKLYQVLSRQGFKVSLRKISQVLVKEHLQKPNRRKQKPRRYKRYEWPLPNYMWHTDWHVIKAKKMKCENILVYIDDCSRKIMGYTTGATTARNSIFALYKAIAESLALPSILNSDRGAHFFPNKRDKKGNAIHDFQGTLKELGIIFVPSRARHPQTNGKNEKFFDILDKEFDERFRTLEEFIQYYNYERLSEAVNYLTPNEAYKKRL